MTDEGTADELETATAPSEYEPQPIPRWQKIAAVVFVLVWGTIIWLWHSRVRADVYPLDRSYVAPNLLASFIIFSLGLMAGALLYPPIRKATHRFMDRKLAPVHAHLRHMRVQHAESKARQDHIIRQQAHLIEHSAAPNVTHDGVDLTVHPLTGEKLTKTPPAKKAPAKKAAARRTGKETT